MATTILIVCPECGKQIKAPDNVLGKKVRCKFCQAAFVARKGGANQAAGGKAVKPSAGKAAPPPAAKPSKPAVDDDEDDEDDGRAYGMVDVSLAPRCPDCANDMEEGQVVCLNCGYNTMTRQKAQMVMTYDTTFMDKFIWLLPGIACALAFLLLVGFDIWYLLRIDKVVNAKDDAFYLTMWTNSGIKLWVIIMSLFGIYFAAKYALRRLVFNYKRPEVEKKK